LTFQIKAKVTTRGGAVAAASVDPPSAGDWNFRAHATGAIDEVFVQLWEPDRRSCTGTLIAEKTLSGSNDKAAHKRHVEPGVYEFSLSSPLDTSHCVRVILWGARGAEVVVDGTTPATSSSPGLPVLPSLPS
jgi:hypothetical protein